MLNLRQRLCHLIETLRNFTEFVGQRRRYPLIVVPASDPATAGCQLSQRSQDFAHQQDARRQTGNRRRQRRHNQRLDHCRLEGRQQRGIN
jgi:hypothetical protein